MLQVVESPEWIELLLQRPSQLADVVVTVTECLESATILGATLTVCMRLAVVSHKLTVGRPAASSLLVRLVARSGHIEDAEALARSGAPQSGSLTLIYLAQELLNSDANRAFSILGTLRSHALGPDNIAPFLRHDFERAVDTLFSGRVHDDWFDGFNVAEILKFLLEADGYERALELLLSLTPDASASACAVLVRHNPPALGAKLAEEYAKRTPPNKFILRFPLDWTDYVGRHVRDRSLFQYLRLIQPAARWRLLVPLVETEQNTFLGRAALNRLGRNIRAGDLGVQVPRLAKVLRLLDDRLLESFLQLISPNTDLHDEIVLYLLAGERPAEVIARLEAETNTSERDERLLNLAYNVIETNRAAATVLITALKGTRAKVSGDRLLVPPSQSEDTVPSSLPKPIDQLNALLVRPTLDGVEQIAISTATEMIDTQYDRSALLLDRLPNWHERYSGREAAALRLADTDLTRAVDLAWKAHKERPSDNSFEIRLSMSVAEILFRHDDFERARSILEPLIPDPDLWIPSPGWEHGGAEQARVRALCILIAMGDDYKDRMDRIWLLVDHRRPMYTWHTILPTATCGLLMLDAQRALGRLRSMEDPVRSAGLCLQGLSDAIDIAPTLVPSETRDAALAFAREAVITKPSDLQMRDRMHPIAGLAKAWLPFDPEQTRAIFQTAATFNGPTGSSEWPQVMDGLWKCALVESVAKDYPDLSIEYARRETSAAVRSEMLLAIFDELRLAAPTIAAKLLDEVGRLDSERVENINEQRRLDSNMLRVPVGSLTESRALELVNTAADVGSSDLLLTLSEELRLPHPALARRSLRLAIARGILTRGPLEHAQRVMALIDQIDGLEVSRDLAEFLSSRYEVSRVIP